MNLKTMTIDGIECQVVDTAAQVIKRHIDTLADSNAKLASAFDAFKKKAAEEEEECDDAATKLADAVKAKDAQIEALKDDLKKATDPALEDARINAKQAVVDKARQILGNKLVSDGKTADEIRKQVVDARYPGKTWDANQVTAVFDSIEVKAPAQRSMDTARVAFNHSVPVPGTQDSQLSAKDAAYAEYDARLTNAWQGTKVA